MTTPTPDRIAMKNIRKMSHSKWLAQVQDYPIEHPKTVHGHSPGGAAAELGLTRSAVHYAVKRGDLDAIIVHQDHDPSKLAAFHITLYSIQRFKEARARERAGKTRSKLVFTDD